MRPLPLALVLVGLVACGCGPAAAGPRWHGPAVDTLGIHLEGCSRPEGPAELPAYLWPLAYRELANRPDLEWVSFALEHEAPIAWPRELVPVLYVGISRERHVPARAFAVGGLPGARALPLAGVLDPDQLWRKRFPCVRRVTSMLFVGYPRGRWDPDSAASVRLERAR